MSASPDRAGRSPAPLIATLAAFVLCLCAAGAAAAGTLPHRPVSTTAASAPTATGFADLFLSTVNGYARAQGDARRVADPDCVEAAPGRYMCSYASRGAGRPPQCHLMQARWTPQLASTYTVTLAGRVKSCKTLRDALGSLG